MQIYVVHCNCSMNLTLLLQLPFLIRVLLIIFRYDMDRFGVVFRASPVSNNSIQNVVRGFHYKHMKVFLPQNSILISFQAFFPQVYVLFILFYCCILGTLWKVLSSKKTLDSICHNYVLFHENVFCCSVNLMS
jgi:hypothetical protein